MFTTQALYRMLADLDVIRNLALNGDTRSIESLDKIAAIAQRLHRQTLDALIAIDRAQKRATERNSKKKTGQSPAQTAIKTTPPKG